MSSVLTWTGARISHRPTGLCITTLKTRRKALSYYGSKIPASTVGPLAVGPLVSSHDSMRDGPADRITGGGVTFTKLAYICNTQ